MIKTKQHICQFCEKEMDVSDRKYMEYPFCRDRICFEKRLETSGAIDMRDNHNEIDLGNGYVEIKPINPNKKFSCSE